MWKSTSGQRRAVSAFVAVAVVMMSAAPAFASVPISITQQGKLLDDDGAPLTGETTLTFALYDDPEGGAILWSDQLDAQLTDTGVYTVRLGDEEQPIDAELLRDGEVYLGLTVDDGQEMSPRLELTAVPFASLAERAQVAKTAESVTDGAIDSDALAEGSVDSNIIEAVNWDQIDDVPSEVAEPTDTLQELNCSDDQLAIHDSSQWNCADVPSYSGDDFAVSEQACYGNEVVDGISATGQIECVEQQDTTYSGQDFAVSEQSCPDDEVAVGISTFGNLQCSPVDSGETYTAGTGLNLSNEEFSLDTGYLDANYHAEGDNISMGSQNIDFDSASGRLEFRDTSFRAANPDRVLLEDGDFSVLDGDLGVGLDSNDDAEGRLHIDQDWNTEALVFERGGTSDFGWALGPASTQNLWFQYSQDVGTDFFSLTAWIDAETGEFNESSDRAVKSDVDYLQGILGRLTQLKPATFHYDRGGDDPQRVYGFVAQQVKKLFPDLVAYDEEFGHYGLPYSKFGVLAIQGIREQQSIIDEQQRQIDELTREMESMDERLQQLEARQ